MPRRRKLQTFVAAVALHAFAVLAFVLAPMLSADDNEIPEYVAVQIVPAQMLGSATPTAPVPRSTPPPEPEPEEEVVEQPVETEPEPEEEAPPPQTVPDPSPRTQPVEPSTPRKVQTRDAGEMSQREGSPTGSRLGTSNFGAAVAGFDNPDFTYDYYVDSMRAQIRQQWVRPAIGGSVEAMVSFRIQKDGRVIDITISRSSGYNSFDLAAMRAVQAASPLPKLPQSFRHKSLGVNLIVR